ncbi:MAG: hypothetical protein M0Q12_00825 [Synergistaceae bacterium]|nr:hypothetical protein [Synergistaceae bacterium]
MARYDSLRKMDRNKLLYDYRNKHPELAWREVGEVFGISRQRAMELYELQKTSEAAGEAASGEKSNGGEG